MAPTTHTAAEPVRRPAEIEEASNAWLIHPVSARLVSVFARIGVSPNIVSVMGMLCGIAAGFCYYHYPQLSWLLGGFLLMVLWHVLDGADGQLARLTRTQSELGKVLDGVCDYATFTSVYVGLAWALAPSHGPGIWLLAVVAGVCHAMQAAAYEAQRQDYMFWGCNRQSAALSAPAQTSGGAARLAGLYLRLQLLVTGVDLSSRRRLAELLARQPDDDARIRRVYRESFAPAVHRWSLLSANNRTLAIFVFAACGRASWYFWFEIVALSLVLAWLLATQQQQYARFFAKVG